MHDKKQISVTVDLSGSYGRDILSGAFAYSLEHPELVIVCEDAARLAEVKGPARRLGVIAQIASPEMERDSGAWGVPVVNVSGALRESQWPRVRNDDEAIGRMAAEYFLARDHVHFAWSGTPRMHLSQERKQGFLGRLRERGHEVLCQDVDVTRIDPVYEKWVRALPRPCAVFAFNDYRARALAQACIRAEIELPDDLSLLGVDNDDQFVWLVPGGLSSVRPNARRIGYLAARTLHEWTQGGKPTPQVLVPPVDIVERGSSNLIAVQDPTLRKAMTFIHQHALEGIGVEDVARGVGVSRRWLETQFSRTLKRKVYQEILRRRLDHAELLLRESELSVEEIAALVGYPEVRQLSTAFRKAKGISPRQYRKSIRLPGN